MKLAKKMCTVAQVYQALSCQLSSSAAAQHSLASPALDPAVGDFLQVQQIMRVLPVAEVGRKLERCNYICYM